MKIQKTGRLFILVLMLVVLQIASQRHQLMVRASSEGKLNTSLDALLHFPLIFNRVGLGNIYGDVVDAESGEGIPDAQVCLGSFCALTNQDGDYTLNGLLSGSRQVTVSAEQRVTISQVILVQKEQTLFYRFVLTRDLIYLGDVFVRTILTWSEEETFTTPLGTFDNDLDAHAWMDILGGITHIYSDPDYKGDCTIFPNICLKYDVKKGSGPETLDISVLEEEAFYYYGVYNVNYPYDPEHLPDLRELGATVALYGEEGLIQLFTVPQTGEGNFWYVFSLDEGGFLTITNCMMSYPGETLPVCPP